MISDVTKKTEDCFVAFVDILNFSNQVIEAEGNYEELAKKLHLIGRTGNVFKELFEKLNFIVVSDSIVISIPVDAIGAETLSALVQLLANIQYNFFNRYGMLMRGGLAMGKMYHDENIFLGEAYLEAYRLESEVARYPRIVISQQILSYAADNRLKDSQYSQYSFNDFCSEDINWDNLYFIDYREYGIKVWKDDLQVHNEKSFLIKQKILEGIYSKDNGIAEKNKWIYDYIYPEFLSIPQELPITTKE